MKPSQFTESETILNVGIAILNARHGLRKEAALNSGGTSKH